MIGDYCLGKNKKKSLLLYQLGVIVMMKLIKSILCKKRVLPFGQVPHDVT